MKRWYLAATVAAAAGAFAMACSDSTAPTTHVPPATPMVNGVNGVSGAAFTTVDQTALGCFNGTGTINCNLYDAKDHVYMSGGPIAASLGAGTYYFAVVVPGFQNAGIPQGADGNLSDPTKSHDSKSSRSYKGAGSGDLICNRTFDVDAAGNITYPSTTVPASCGTHVLGTQAVTGKTIVQLMPYDNTTNNGGVYILYICKAGLDPTDPANCKYDAFKVRVSGTTPTPVLTVSKTAAGTYSRAYTWDVRKTTPSATISAPLAGGATVNYTITATNTGNTNSGFNVAGSIDVSYPTNRNPTNAPTSATVQSVVDETNLSAVPTAAITGCKTVSDNVARTLPYALALGQTLRCTYSQDFTWSSPDYTSSFQNTATANVTDPNDPTGQLLEFVGTANFSFSSGPSSFTTNCVDVKDDFDGAATPTKVQVVCIQNTTPIPTVTNLSTIAEGGSWSGPYSGTTRSYVGLQACGATVQIPNVASVYPYNGSTLLASYEVDVTATLACQGCTPGYWKNNDANSSGTAWLNVSPAFQFGTLLNSTNPYAFGAIFAGYGGPTSGQDMGYYSMMAALNFQGGSDLTGKAQNLLRIATASLLNASWSDGTHHIAFPMTQQGIRDAVQQALASGDATQITALQTTLDGYNNQSCPINAAGLWSAQ